jgi:hypothetical protein
MKRLISMLLLTAITSTVLDAANYSPQDPKVKKEKTVNPKKMVKKVVKKKPLKVIAVAK